MLPGAFPDKGNPDIDFIDETVVQYDLPVVKVLLSVLVIYKWSQINFNLNTYEVFLDPVLCKVLVF